MASVILAFGEGSWRELLRYDRIAVGTQGEWWRWLSAHLVHAGWSHMVVNVAALWVVWLLFKWRLGSSGGWFILVVSLVVMDAGFWFRDTQLGWYVGMSGLLHGFFAAGAWDEVWRGVRGGTWLLLGLLAKLGYEQFFGALPMTAASSDGPVWVNAHLYGAIGGLVAAAILNVKLKFAPLGGRISSNNEKEQ